MKTESNTCQNFLRTAEGRVIDFCGNGIPREGGSISAAWVTTVRRKGATVFLKFTDGAEAGMAFTSFKDAKAFVYSKVAAQDNDCTVFLNGRCDTRVLRQYVGKADKDGEIRVTTKILLFGLPLTVFQVFRNFNLRGTRFSRVVPEDSKLRAAQIAYDHFAR